MTVCVKETLTCHNQHMIYSANTTMNFLLLITGLGNMNETVSRARPTRPYLPIMHR